MRFIRRCPLAASLLAAFAAAPLAAQGVGTTGAQVMQLPAGARAAALSGAYTAASGDADVLFYNPAGIAGLHRAAALSYQRHVMDVSLGSISGAARVGPVVIGAGIAYLDAGRIRVTEPDPDFGGERGRETGASAAARENALRLAVGMPLLGDRVHLGAAAGFASSELAGVSRSAPFLDVGAQAGFDLDAGGGIPIGLTLGAALRNAGGSLSGSGAQDAELPMEARAGMSVQATGPQGLGAVLTGDFIAALREETYTGVGGVEVGILPVDPERLSAVLRVGYNADPDLHGLNALQLGAGISLSGISVDYFYQGSSDLGAAHRIGVRWLQGRR